MRFKTHVVPTIAACLISFATLPAVANPLNDLGRYLGIGWSEGYHAWTNCPCDRRFSQPRYLRRNAGEPPPSGGYWQALGNRTRLANETIHPQPTIPAEELDPSEERKDSEKDRRSASEKEDESQPTPTKPNPRQLEKTPPSRSEKQSDLRDEEADHVSPSDLPAKGALRRRFMGR